MEWHRTASLSRAFFTRRILSAKHEKEDLHAHGPPLPVGHGFKELLLEAKY